MLGFLFEEHGDHLLRGEGAELARAELFGFARQFAQDLEARSRQALPSQEMFDGGRVGP